MSDCIICKLISGELPAYKVYEDEFCLAFLEINPSATGHTLVSPKKHIATFFDLTDNEIAELFSRVKKIAHHIKNSDLKPDGLNIGMNQWPAAGQGINHLHVHIIPRWENDGDGCIQTVVSNKSVEKLEDVLNKIKMQ